ncbi:hypothetical protein H8K90_05700 [Winogradskyella echinorum]|uniref:Lipoprotein n=1 Tax=Winogradskyella echinorum TaxID=538189 RepID=A0ABR6XZD4_9FLAO|nr:hypothetical protein [Winogradskyella echinorum]MBC3845863.1 hypothetical protein [Winogradskyella echinorum]MBC5750211.1 hypothetical protein [Winogradskyella echinorum]
MRKIIYILISVGLFSCNEPAKKQIIEEIVPRQLIIYEMDTIKRKDDYKLTIKNKDSLIQYEYINLVDSTKNMDFKFIKSSNKIHFGNTEFLLEEKNLIQNKYKFDRYETKPVTDGMGSLYFNLDYGVLGFDNGWGMQFHYLTEENKSQFDLPLFYIIGDSEQ